MSDELAKLAYAFSDAVLRIETLTSMEMVVAACSLHMQASKHIPAEQRMSDLDASALFQRALRRYQDHKADQLWKARPTYCQRCDGTLVNGRGGCEGKHHGSKGCAMNNPESDHDKHRVPRTVERP